MQTSVLHLVELILIATVLTACGIETIEVKNPINPIQELQQYLPLAVLKHSLAGTSNTYLLSTIATVLTACGIET